MKSLLSNQVTWLTLTFGLVTMVNTIPVTINENNINQHSNHQPVNPTTSFNQKVILSLHQHLQPTLQPSTSSTSIATKLSSNQAKSHNPNHKVSNQICKQLDITMKWLIPMKILPVFWVTFWLSEKRVFDCLIKG